MAKLIHATIIVTDRLAGKGIEGNPLRSVEEYYAPDGTLLLEYDAVMDRTACAIDMVAYLRKLAEKPYRDRD